MKQWITMLGLGLALTVGQAWAAGEAAPAAPAKGKTAQQGKMAACNKDAGDQKLTGDARKAFMKDCLSAKPAGAPADAKPAAAPATGKAAQQEKMKTCNKDAGDKKLKGDERKAFMKSCLSNKG